MLPDSRSPVTYRRNAFEVILTPDIGMGVQAYTTPQLFGLAGFFVFLSLQSAPFEEEKEPGTLRSKYSPM